MNYKDAAGGQHKIESEGSGRSLNSGFGLLAYGTFGITVFHDARRFWKPSVSVGISLSLGLAKIRGQVKSDGEARQRMSRLGFVPSFAPGCIRFTC